MIYSSLVRVAQWRCHGEWVGQSGPPLMFRPFLKLAQIRWKVFLYIGGSQYSMYVYCNFYYSPEKWFGPPTFFWAGDAIELLLTFPVLYDFQKAKLGVLLGVYFPDNPAHHGPADVHPSRVDCRMLWRHRNVLHGSHVLFDRKSTKFIFRLKCVELVSWYQIRLIISLLVWLNCPGTTLNSSTPRARA